MLYSEFYMLFYLSLWLKQYFTIVNVLQYVSFRAIMALLTALFLSLIAGNWFIILSQRFFKAKAREFTPENHKAKDTTPTMGGLFIIMIVLATSLLWANITDTQVLVLLGTLLGFGFIGFCDDYYKIIYKKGISEGVKFRAQFIVATLVVLTWIVAAEPATTISFPFLKSLNPNIGVFFILWAIFLLIGTSNAVNLTDGLDGLAISSLIMNFGTFSVIAYIAGHTEFAQYLQIPFAGTSEIVIIGGALIGASLGFLWFNAYPAQIFMGDVGSLALGGTLAMLALMTKQELLLAISGGLFVVETISVILQVFTYKRWKTRLFKMAPLHHHFELLGWPESKITVRFGIISCVLCLLALITLKLR